MKSASEIAKENVKNCKCDDTEEMVSWWEPAIKQAQINILEWVFRSYLYKEDDDFFLDKVWDKIKELKGEK